MGEKAWASGILVSEGYVARVIKLERELSESITREGRLIRQVKEADVLLAELQSERDALRTLTTMMSAEIEVERHNVASLQRERWWFGASGVAAGAVAAAGVCYIKE